ncbi:MAG: GAF and ANTAR domain-containing protein [Nocardioidaceae bacterium]
MTLGGTNVVDEPDAMSDDIMETFTAVHSLVLSTQNMEAFVDEVARLAATVIDPPASAGVMVRRDDAPVTAAASDALASRVDETQYEVGDGPCMETLRTGVVVEVKDQSADERWGSYAPRAVEHGVRSSLSLPLLVQGEPAGALNIYSGQRAGAFDGPQRKRAELFAAQASMALTLMIRQVAQAEVRRQLEQALTSRSVIDQALGILMGRERCSSEEAFALLRRHSQDTNRKLRDVAAELVTRVTGQAPSDAPSFQHVRVRARPE